MHLRHHHTNSRQSTSGLRSLLTSTDAFFLPLQMLSNPKSVCKMHCNQLMFSKTSDAIMFQGEFLRLINHEEDINLLNKGQIRSLHHGCSFKYLQLIFSTGSLLSY